MLKRVSGIAASAALIGGLVLAAPAIAQAEPAAPSASAAQSAASAQPAAKCPKKAVCLYTKKNLKGGMAWFKKGSHDLRDFGMNNKASSAWNRTGRYVPAWKKINYKGQCAYIPKGKSNMYKSWNNKISSLYVRGKSC